MERPVGSFGHETAASHGRCVFVSDLHHFARRSQQERFEEQLREAVRRSDRVVLGGDIFDFKWSTLADHRRTVEAAAEWLEALTELNAGCRIDYVLGNHDFDPLLMRRLDELTLRRERFRWHKYVLQVASSLFLHGDVADRRTTHQGLESRRERWSVHRPPHPLRHDLYDLALKFQLHKVPSALVHRPRSVMRRLLYYVDRHPELDRASIRRIYFGHTHVPIDGLRFDGIDFYNPGAPIGGLPFRLIDVRLD